MPHEVETSETQLMETNKYKNPMAQKTKCFSGYISGSDIESSWDWFFFSIICVFGAHIVIESEQYNHADKQEGNTAARESSFAGAAPLLALQHWHRTMGQRKECVKKPFLSALHLLPFT